MIPPQFDYVRPADLGEALRILKDREGEAKLLGGGYSLIPLLKLRLAQPALLVDLRDVGGLDGIVETDDELVIGGRATHRRILEDPAVQARWPLLVDAASVIGDPQVRNWGTIGGSVAHADPAADWPSVLVASDATIQVRSVDGERQLPARGFFLDPFVMAIEPTEVLTGIRIPRRDPRSGGAYEKLERRAGDFATAGAAVQLQLGDDGRIKEVGIALTNVADHVVAAVDAEQRLRGAEPTDENLAAAARDAAAASSPVADVRGPVEYKRAMAAEMTIRALRRAVARARGEA
jgi:carbon-monoxide dehydrogenase medium subunit